MKWRLHVRELSHRHLCSAHLVGDPYIYVRNFVEQKSNGIEFVFRFFHDICGRHSSLQQVLYLWY